MIYPLGRKNTSLNPVKIEKIMVAEDSSVL